MQWQLAGSHNQKQLQYIHHTIHTSLMHSSFASNSPFFLLWQWWYSIWSLLIVIHLHITKWHSWMAIQEDLVYSVLHPFHTGLTGITTLQLCASVHHWKCSFISCVPRLSGYVVTDRELSINKTKQLMVENNVLNMDVDANKLQSDTSAGFGLG